MRWPVAIAREQNKKMPGPMKLDRLYKGNPRNGDMVCRERA
jgi:hypothetical protein